MITSNGAITITGRVTKDIRFGNVQGSEVANFTVAFECGTIPKMATIDGREQLVYVGATSYFDLAAWDSNAADAQQLERGQEVTVDVTSIMAKGRVHEGKVFADVTGRASNIRPGAKAKNAVPNPGATADTRAQASNVQTQGSNARPPSHDFDDSEIPF